MFFFFPADLEGVSCLANICHVTVNIRNPIRNTISLFACCFGGWLISVALLGYPFHFRAFVTWLTSWSWSATYVNSDLALEKSVQDTAIFWAKRRWRWKSRYLSACVTFLWTVVERDPSGWCVITVSRNATLPFSSGSK